jgi:phosphoglycolate phosphatase-like HAD superfamily hydrolase
VHDLLWMVNATKLVDAATSSGDVERSKPDPDIVRAALVRTGYPPSQVVMLGDTPYDIEAARRTGIGIIALRCGGWNDAALAGAMAIYDDPQDLLDHYALSPFKHASPSPAVPHTA